MPTLPYRMTHAMNPPPHPPRPATEEVRFLGDIQRLALSPGDVLVLSSEEHISEDSAARLRRLLEDNFPGHKALVLGGGTNLGVVSPSDTTQCDRIEAKLDTLIAALSDSEEDQPERTLDGELVGGERDQSQGL